MISWFSQTLQFLRKRYILPVWPGCVGEQEVTKVTESRGESVKTSSPPAVGLKRYTLQGLVYKGDLVVFANVTFSAQSLHFAGIGG